MADDGAGRCPCLSDLSDDLLRHIFLAPDRESTTVLSRRWRWLWRLCTSIDSRFFVGGCFSLDQEREAFHRGAEEALAAAAALGPIRRLTSIAQDSKISLRWWCTDWECEHNLMEALVSNPTS